MRRCTLRLVLLLALSVSLVARGEPRVSVSARLDNPFLVEEVKVEGLEPVSTLTLNLSAVHSIVDHVMAAAEGVFVNGSPQNGLLRFDFGRPVTSARVRIVFRALNMSGGVATLTVPLVLAPLEVNEANTSFIVWGIPSQPFDVVSRFNVSKGYSPELLNYLKGNTTSGPGDLEVVKASFSASGLPPAIEKLTRTIVVEPGSLTILDNYTLTGVSWQGASSLSLTYAADVELKSVRGLVTSYPPTHYNFIRLNGSTKIRVTLLAPPYGAGDKSYVQLELSTVPQRVDSVFKIPAFVGVERYVPEVRVLVKVRGTATFRGLTPVKEWLEDGYSVYELGTFKLLGEGVEGAVQAEVKFSPQAPVPYIVVGALLAALTALAYLAFTRARRREAAPAPVETVVVASELSEALKERISNIETLLDAWYKYSAGRLSRQAYRQLVSKLRRREEELRKRCRDAALGEAGTAEKLDKVDELVAEILGRLSKMEEAKRSIERGTLSKREGKKLLDKLQGEMEELLDELRAEAG